MKEDITNEYSELDCPYTAVTTSTTTCFFDKRLSSNAIQRNSSMERMKTNETVMKQRQIAGVSHSNKLLPSNNPNIVLISDVDVRR